MRFQRAFIRWNTSSTPMSVPSSPPDASNGAPDRCFSTARRFRRHSSRRAMRLPERILGVLMLLAAGGTAVADPVDLKPFRATYIAEWKGMTAAASTVELKKIDANLYTYSSVNTARGIFRMAFPDALSQK